MKDDIREVLNKFLLQVKRNDHETSNFPSFYSSLKLKVGFGFGNEAKIPWITFLGKDQEPQNGIFSVYYFYKKHQKLILAYGISETNPPQKNWSLSSENQSIQDRFKEIGITPYKYGSSYVYAIYDTNRDLDWNKIRMDLETIITQYKKLLPVR